MLAASLNVCGFYIAILHTAVVAVNYVARILFLSYCVMEKCCWLGPFFDLFPCTGALYIATGLTANPSLASMVVHKI